MNIYFKLLTYFMIYSFLGWIMESIYRSMCEKKLINTGFLHGPACPIYGIGALIMLLVLDGFKDKPVALFFIAIILLTFWEYMVGLGLEKVFKTKYWDYSDKKFNLQGRVCLQNSLYWGVLGVLFVKFIHPFIEGLVAQVDINILYYIISISTAIMAVDEVLSIKNMISIRATLDRIEKLQEQIKEKLLEIKSIAKEETISTENIQKIVEKLNKQRDKTARKLYKNVYRLKKAFPAIDTKEITEALSQKIEKYKKIRKNKEA